MRGNINEAPLLMIMHQVIHLTKHQAVPLFREFDLKPGSAGILFTLNEFGSMSQRELADRVGIKPPSMTVALKKMERQGYVSRTPDDSDQRVTQIEMLEKGRKCVIMAKKAISEMEAALFNGFSQEEKMLFRRLMLQMHTNLIEYNGWSEEDLEAHCGHIGRRRERHDEKTI